MVFLTFSILELKNRFLVDLNPPVLKASGVRKKRSSTEHQTKELAKKSSRYQQEVTTYNNYHDKGVVTDPEYDKREAQLMLSGNSYSYYCIGNAWQQRESKDLNIGSRMRVQPGSQKFITPSLNARVNVATIKKVAS